MINMNVTKTFGNKSERHNGGWARYENWMQTIDGMTYVLSIRTIDHYAAYLSLRGFNGDKMTVEICLKENLKDGLKASYKRLYGKLREIYGAGIRKFHFYD